MKKIGSILVLAVFLMTLIPVMPTFAAVDATRIYTEDFSGTFDIDHFTSSAIFNDGEWKDNYIASTDGYNGGTTALTLAYDGRETSSPSGNNHIKTKTLTNFGLTADKKLVFNVRFKLNGTPTSGYSWTINLGTGYVIGTIAGTADGKYSVTRYSGGDPATLLGEKWYDLIVPLGTTGAAWGYIYDSATGEFIVQTQGTGVKPDMTTAQLFIQTSSLKENLSLTLDDAKMYCVTSADTFNYVADGSTVADSEIGEDGLITVKFDQPIIPAKTNFTVTGATVDSVAVKDFNTAIVKVSGLSLGQSYTLNFSNVKSAAGTALTETTTLEFKAPAKTHFTQGYVLGTDFNNDVFKNSSEIFYEGKWSDNTYFQGEGYLSGEHGIKIENPDDEPVADQLTTKRLSSFGLTRDNVLIFTTRFKFSGESAANTYWNINPVTSTANLVSIGGGVNGQYFADAEPIDADKWYNMSVAIRPDQRSTLMINDSVTGETIVYKSAKTPATSVVDYAYNYLWFQTSSLVKGTSLTLADTDIYIVSGDDTLTVDAAASTAQNSTIAPDGTISVQFDMPVFSHKVVGVEDGVAFVEKNNFTVEGADIGKIGVIDFNKVVVGFYNLNYLSDYVLDFSNIVYEGGAGLDSTSVSSLAFKTGMDPDNDITMVGGVNCSGTSVGDTVKFTLCTPSADITNVSFIVAFFDSENSKMIGAELVPGQDISATPNEYTVPVEKDYTGADNIKVIILENFSTLRPLIRDINSAIE